MPEFFVVSEELPESHYAQTSSGKGLLPLTRFSVKDFDVGKEG